MGLFGQQKFKVVCAISNTAWKKNSIKNFYGEKKKRFFNVDAQKTNLRNENIMHTLGKQSIAHDSSQYLLMT